MKTLALKPADPSRYPSDADLRGYDRAQSFAKMVAATIASQVKPGMSERDAMAITRAVFREHDVQEHWHMPLVGVGEGSTKFTSAGRFLKYLAGAGQRILTEGDILFLDIAPCFEGYPSDFTLTQLYGQNAGMQKMIDTALSLTRNISTHLREDMRGGTTWAWIKDEIEARCPYDLRQFPISPVAHRFARVPAAWPRVPEAGTLHLFTMGSPLLLRSSTTTMRGLWVIEPLLVDRTVNRAAKTEEIVFVTGGETLIFGERPFAELARAA